MIGVDLFAEVTKNDYQENFAEWYKKLKPVTELGQEWLDIIETINKKKEPELMVTNKVILCACKVVIWW